MAPGRDRGAEMWHRVAPALMVALLLLSSSARAAWNRPQEINLGTAYTLAHKQLRIGVLAPMSYGVHDRVTVSTHPILDLLLVFNMAMQVRVLDAPFALSAAVSYSQSFFVQEGERPEGNVRGFALASVPLARRVLVTTTFGADQDLDEKVQALIGTAAAHLLLSSNDLLVVQGGVSKRLQHSEPVRPTGLLLYAHAFGQMRIGAGAAVGDPLSPAPTCLDANGTPICLHADIWWLF